MPAWQDRPGVVTAHQPVRFGVSLVVGGMAVGGAGGFAAARRAV